MSSIQEGPRQCVVYARFSPRPMKPIRGVPMLDAVISNEVQIDRCRAWVESQGHHMAAPAFTDEFVSGSKMLGRDGLVAAMAKVCEIHGLMVVYSLSRLARNTADALEIIGILRNDNADLASVSQGIDTSTPTGRAFFTMCAAFDTLERENIAERTSASLLYRQERGQRIGRPDRPPFGWRLKIDGPQRTVISTKDGCEVLIPAYNEHDPEEMVLVRRIKSMAATLRPAEIRRALVKEHVKCRGKRWDDRVIQRIIDRNYDVEQEQFSA